MTDALPARLRSARQDAARLRTVPTDVKNAVLREAARLLGEYRAPILAANAADLAALDASSSAAFHDRLMLDPARLDLAARGLDAVARLPDPVGEEVDRRTLPNGLIARRVRSPLGVCLLIFESRPNVAIESFSLALKSGNLLILRGGKESSRSVAALAGIIGEALEKCGLARGSVWAVTDPDRELLKGLLSARQWIDVVIPRGGEALIEFVVTHSRIPIIKNDRGLCHVYVHADADPQMALAIVDNAKTQRPGVCNAMETLLVHSQLAPAFLPLLHARLAGKGVEWACCPRSLALLPAAPGVRAAAPEDWDTEYLDLKMSCRVVDSLEDAIAHIEIHGSRHSEAIVTRSEPAARRFQDGIDAAVVYWNASTRFTDGFELGLGGELGVSTQKLHVRGPVGLRELTSVRWIVDGSGQTRA